MELPSNRQWAKGFFISLTKKKKKTPFMIEATFDDGVSAVILLAALSDILE